MEYEEEQSCQFCEGWEEESKRQDQLQQSSVLHQKH
jgi:hypothetical protein